MRSESGRPRSAVEGEHAFVADLARRHGQRLRRFLASRFGAEGAEVPDLVQEVYLRLLRVPRQDAIRNPQAYLFTVARHVLYQHKLSTTVTTESLDADGVLADLDTLVSEDDPTEQAEGRQRLELLNRALGELSPKCRAAFILQRRYGYTLDEIGTRLGVSRAMVKKHVARALAHCHLRLYELVRRASDGNGHPEA
jgi:RNA polymerase sigma-70 factor (ECF subfamily)